MIKKTLIYLDDDLINRDAILRKMSKDVEEEGLITDVSSFITAVLNREAEIPTTVGYGVSIPHGKSESVVSPFITFMRTKKSFIWDERIQEDTQLIFMIGVPTTQQDKLHLKILAQISKNLMDETFRANLLEAETSDEAYRLLKCIEDTIYSEEMGNVK